MKKATVHLFVFTLDKLRPSNSSMLVLPGGSAWDMKKNKEAAQLAADFLAKGTAVAAICGATTGLARIGLLDDVPHTSNSTDYIVATGYKGAAFFRNKLAAKSGSLITASAMCSGQVFLYQRLRGAKPLQQQRDSNIRYSDARDRSCSA